MGLLERYGFRKAVNTSGSEPPARSYAATNVQANEVWKALEKRDSIEARTLRRFLEQEAKPTPAARGFSVGLPDIGFKGVRQQLFQRFNLVDLYAIAHNNSVIKTAVGSLKQEVFRRGLKWDKAFMYRDGESGNDYSLEDLVYLRENAPERYLEIRDSIYQPDINQRLRFEQLMQNCNIYGQSMMMLMQAIEDDLNVADDAFIFLSSDYEHRRGPNGEETIRREVRQIFRLDPIFVEFDTDNENRPGFAHHLCLWHREDLLDIPQGDGWEYEWQGRCPADGFITFPVYYRYAPYKGTFGTTSGQKSADQQAQYFVKGEIIHASKFAPSELYGYSPILSIYEKALSLIGMDRYLYDYFFERQIPQGVITTTTDNPEDLEIRKEQMLAEVLNNPHYIPWLAVSSKTGQGKTEFVRFCLFIGRTSIPASTGTDRAFG